MDNPVRRCSSQHETDKIVHPTVKPYFFGNNGPPYCAPSPSCSSIRSSWLYLAMRSLREALPVLIWPVLKATARSAIVLS